MKTSLTLVASVSLAFGLAACAAPAEEEDTDTGPEVATVNTATDDTVGDSSDAPDMATVQLALGEACVGFPTTLRETSCEATELGETFECEFALESDAAGATRELSLTQSEGGWSVEQEPEFCSSLERAAERADEPADASVPTQPTE